MRYVYRRRSVVRSPHLTIPCRSTQPTVVVVVAKLANENTGCQSFFKKPVAPPIHTDESLNQSSQRVANTCIAWKMGTTNENALLANVWCAEAENHFAIRYVLNACVYTHIYNNTQRVHRAHTEQILAHSHRTNANAKGETRRKGSACARLYVFVLWTKRT